MHTDWFTMFTIGFGDSPKYFTFPKVLLVGDLRVAEHFVFEQRVCF